MNGKMIVLFMMSILVLLFLLASRFRKKELKTNILEANSFEAINKWTHTKNSENRQKALEANTALAMAHGMNEDQAKKHAEQELAKLD